jgi:orotate phosphoribosyltransferase
MASFSRINGRLMTSTARSALATRALSSQARSTASRFGVMAGVAAAGVVAAGMTTVASEDSIAEQLKVASSVMIDGC